MENVHALIQVRKDAEDIEKVIRAKQIFETRVIEKQNIIKQLDNTVTNLKQNLTSIEPIVSDQEGLNNQFNAIIDNTLSKITTVIEEHQAMKIKFKGLCCECNRVNLLTKQMIDRFRENSKRLKESIALAKINLENNMRLKAKQTIDFEALKAQKQLQFTSTANKLASLQEETHQLVNQLNQIQIDNESIYNEVASKDIAKENLQMVANSTKMELIDSQKISAEIDTFRSTLLNEFEIKQDMLKRKKDNQDNLQLKFQQLKEDFVIQISNYNKLCEEEGLPSHDVSLFLSDPGAYSMKLFQTIKDYIALKIQEQDKLDCELDASHCVVTDQEKDFANLLEQYQSSENEIESNTETINELKKISTDYFNIQNEIPLKQAFLSQMIAENGAKKSTRFLAHEEMKQGILQKKRDTLEKGEEVKKANDIVINSFKVTIYGLKSKFQKYDKYFDNTKRKIAATESSSSKKVIFN